MIKFENTKVMGVHGAMRGMRNPMESWDKSDTRHCIECDISCDTCPYHRAMCASESFIIGPNDQDLAMRLRKAGGAEHRKFMRMIHVQVDITAGHTWWAEFDTYKVGVTRNSCSKMHRIHIHPFTRDMFDTDGIEMLRKIDLPFGDDVQQGFGFYIGLLEVLRQKFNETHEKAYWRCLIDMLPMGFHLKATIDMNYENVSNMYAQREHHKMTEWAVGFREWAEALPYSWLITGEMPMEEKGAI